MPQAPSYLRAMFADDADAWQLLPDHYDDRGVIRPKIVGALPTDKQAHAIDYLILEWDYGYEQTPEVGSDARLIAVVHDLLAVAQQFVDTIHSVEQRCMAADGPVTRTHQEITDAELRAVYVAAVAAIQKAAP